MALTTNKYLIVTVAPDGNKQVVTTASYGDSEIDGLDEWEVSAGKLQPKAGVAPNGVSIATAATAYDKLFADYTNVGANLNTVAGTYQNDTMTLVPSSVSASSEYSATFNADKANDGDSGTYWQTTVGGSPTTETYTWNFASAVDFETITATEATSGNPQGADSITLIEKDVGAGFVTHDSNTNNLSYSSRVASVTTSLGTGADAIRVTFTKSTTYLRFEELVWEGPASTDNTAEVNMHTGGSVNFAPASLELTDENDTDISGAGKVNVDYKLNNGSYTGTLIDLETFRALDPSTFAGVTQLDLKFQPVGDQRIKDPSIDSESSESLILDSGTLRVLVDSAIVGQMSGDGYTFPDTTIQATAVNKVAAPSSASDTGTTGQIAWDTGYIYICTATDTWKRVAVATW